MFHTEQRIKEVFEQRFQKAVYAVFPYSANIEVTVEAAAAALAEFDQFTGLQANKGCYFGDLIFTRIDKTIAGELAIKANTLQAGTGLIQSPTLVKVYQDSLHSFVQLLAFKDLDLLYTGADAAAVQLVNINFTGYKILFA